MAGTRRHAPRVLGRARPAQRADRRRPRGPRGPRLAPRLGRRARSSRRPAHERPRTRWSTRLRDRFAAHAGALGLEGEADVAYRPRSRAQSADALAAELAERTDSDLERGFTGHGPHRDELALRREGRELRVYGSRGQVRLGLLALLLAERDELAAERGAPPLLLLDDVMSELDAPRRARLVDVLRAGGQTIVTATELGHVPGADEPGVVRVAIAEGRVLQAADERTEGPVTVATDGDRLNRGAEARGQRSRGEAASTHSGFRRARGADRPAVARDAARRGPAAWPAAAGPMFAPYTEPWAERDGEVVVACSEAVRAQELDLMSELVVERLNQALGRPAVRRLRVQARRAPTRER